MLAPTLCKILKQLSSDMNQSHSLILGVAIQSHPGIEYPWVRATWSTCLDSSFFAWATRIGVTA